MASLDQSLWSEVSLSPCKLHTLGFLINVQALIKVQGGKMLAKNNRAGSNKRAGGKNFRRKIKVQAQINVQDGNWPITTIIVEVQGK